MDDLLRHVYAPLAGTQVGALFWCVGEHQARWKSAVLEMVGEFTNRRYENARDYIYAENILAMLERGEDPQAAIVRRGREMGLHVYFSVRVNDNHFGTLQPEDLRSHPLHGELTRMRVDHPEWLLSSRAPRRFGASWDLSVPEVRANRLAHIEEVCRLYDWDGIELDWQRHAFHFPAGHGHRMMYALTDLQRAARKVTRALGVNRGRPYYLAARVSGSMEQCRRIGYDLPTWVQQGLVDILIPAAGGAATDPSINLAEFLDLCRGTDVQVYPGLDSGLPIRQTWPEDERTRDVLRTRAIAARYHRDGARGIYVFNWHANAESRRAQLTEIGSPETLRGKDKLYAATHYYDREDLYKGDALRGEVPVALVRTLTGDGPSFTIDIAEDGGAAPLDTVELRVRLDQWVKGDFVRVFWDGHELDGATVRYEPARRPALGDVSAVSWHTYALTPGQAGPGEHRARAVMEQRNPRIASDIVLTDVEVLVRYHSGA